LKRTATFWKRSACFKKRTASFEQTSASFCERSAAFEKRSACFGKTSASFPKRTVAFLKTTASSLSLPDKIYESASTSAKITVIQGALCLETILHIPLHSILLYHRLQRELSGSDLRRKPFSVFRHHNKQSFRITHH
jgi:hypothetical protein